MLQELNRTSDFGGGTLLLNPLSLPFWISLCATTHHPQQSALLCRHLFLSTILNRSFVKSESDTQEEHTTQPQALAARECGKTSW